MFFAFLQISSPLIALMINVIAQILSFRFFPRIGLLKSVILGFVIGLLSLFPLMSYVFFLKNSFFSTIVVDFFIYLPLGYCYFHFINLGETARRIRILREIYDSENGLSMKEILERYSAVNVVEMRLQRLLGNGQIVDNENRYYIGKPTMLLITKVLAMIKLVILGKSRLI